MQCDVFISYRRDGGDMTAMYVYQALKERGYSVFFDLEVLRAGKFNEALLQAIDSCNDFVLILSPHALDRCAEKGDWVRREIAEALAQKKNIVPVMMNGFHFPDTLPEDIDDVRFQNGLSATTEYFSESMDRLCSRYLTSKPVNAPVKSSDPTTRPWAEKQPKRGKGLLIGGIIAGITMIAAVILAVTGVFGGGKKPEEQNPPVSVTATAAPEEPTEAPVTDAPTEEPTETPTEAPTEEPTATPTEEPTEAPTATPTEVPTEVPTEAPTEAPAALAAVPDREAMASMDLPVLRLDIFEEGEHNDEEIADFMAFGGPWTRRQINRIEFTDREAGEDAWDVSEAQDGSIMAWAETVDDYRTLYISAGGGPIRLPEGIGSMFQSYKNADSLEWNGLVDFSRVTDAGCTFSFSGFETLDFSGADLSSLRQAGQMFQRCDRLKELKLKGSRMNHLTHTNCMFEGCNKLDTLDVSDMDVSRVQDMGRMFAECNSLRSLDLSTFNTRRVTSMNGLFDQCRRLISLTFSEENWDTTLVTDMQFMFSHCEMLEDLDVHFFRTARVENMSYMFDSCYMLQALDVSGFNTGNVKDMCYMFNSCELVENLELSKWDTSSVTKMEGMFLNCRSLLSLDVSGELFDTSKVTSMQSMFSGCAEMDCLDVIGLETDKVIDFGNMFTGCMRLKELNVSGFDLSSAENMREMFYNCIALEDIGTDPAKFGKENAPHSPDTTDMYLNTPLDPNPANDDT